MRDESRVLRAVEATPQGHKDSLQISAQQSLGAEPKARKDAALEEAVRRRGEFLAMSW